MTAKEFREHQMLHNKADKVRNSGLEDDKEIKLHDFKAPSKPLSAEMAKILKMNKH